MREAAQVTAAVEIARAARVAIVDATGHHRETGWDDTVLYVELGRVTGVLLRRSDAPPDRRRASR